ncbi:unnamed protein product [Sphagnum balticum]
MDSASYNAVADYVYFVNALVLINSLVNPLIYSRLRWPKVCCANMAHRRRRKQMLVGAATTMSRGGVGDDAEEGVSRKPTMQKISTNAEYRRCISGVSMTRSAATTPLLPKQQQSTGDSDEPRLHESTRYLKVRVHRQSALDDNGGGEALDALCAHTDSDQVTRV